MYIIRVPEIFLVKKALLKTQVGTITNPDVGWFLSNTYMR